MAHLVASVDSSDSVSLSFDASKAADLTVCINELSALNENDVQSMLRASKKINKTELPKHGGLCRTFSKINAETKDLSVHIIPSEKQDVPEHISVVTPKKMKSDQIGVSLSALSQKASQLRPAVLLLGAKALEKKKQAVVIQSTNEEYFISGISQLVLRMIDLHISRTDPDTPVRSAQLFSLAKWLHKELSEVGFKRNAFHQFKAACQGKEAPHVPGNVRFFAHTWKYPDSQLVAFLHASGTADKNKKRTLHHLSKDWPIDIWSIKDSEWSLIENELFRGVQYRMCVPRPSEWRISDDKKDLINMLVSLFRPKLFFSEQEEFVFSKANLVMTANVRTQSIVICAKSEGSSASVEQDLKRMVL